MIILGSPFMHPPGTMISAIERMGLTSGLQICLDAADGNSYSSGQQWTDLSSTGHHFNRGSGSGADAADPTFHGSANGQSVEEYWDCISDYFTLASTNTTFLNSLHKNSALFTILVWAHSGANCGDTGPDGIGIDFGYRSAKPALTVWRSSSDQALDVESSMAVTADEWNFSGLAFDEANGNLTFCVNGAYEALTGKTYSSPSSSNAGYTFQVGASGSGSGAGAFQVAAFLAWNRALSQSEMTNLYEATRIRFGV